MHNRMPSRRRRPSPPSGVDADRQGQTVPAQDGSQAQRRVPRMPHERDESSDKQRAAEPSAQRVGGAAHDGIERGQVDTDRGPVLDKTYERVRAGTPDRERKPKP